MIFMGEEVSAMIADITAALTGALGWFGSVVTAIFGEAGVLHDAKELILVGVGISLAMLGISVARRFLWGGK